MTDVDEEWPSAEYRKNFDWSSGPEALFMESDSDEEAGRQVSSARTTAHGASSTSDSKALLDRDPRHRRMNNSREERESQLGGSVSGPARTPAATAASGEGGDCRGHWALQWILNKESVLLFGGFLLTIVTKGTIACFETLGAEYATRRFGMASAEAGSTFATFGFLGVLSLLSMRFLCRHFNDVHLVLGGMAVMIVSCVLLVPAPSGPSGLPFFLLSVFLMYSIGYPIGHTAVSASRFAEVASTDQNLGGQE